jgi:hypothetical protein
MKKLWIIICLVFLSYSAFSMSARPRLREHFDDHKIKSGDQEYTYKGFSNTFNLWYEKPFDFALGLALTPILGNIKHKEGIQTTYGEKIKLFGIGVEFKHFPLKLLPQAFYRAGAYYTELQTDALIGDQTGLSVLGGIGYEFKVWKMGIAPEFAIRRSFLQNSTSVLTMGPAIGFHFYVM